MTAIPFPIGGSTFFADVRTRMNADRGMFVGADGNSVFVCMDATFYKLEIFTRPVGLRFKFAAASLPTDVRVVANGQFYAPHCKTGPCATRFEGEIIRSGVVENGIPPTRPAYSHIGQWSGRGAAAFKLGVGDPSGVTAPAALVNAMGGLLPLVRGRVRVGAKEQRDGSGNVTQYGSPSIGSLLVMPRFLGWTAYGIHRQSQTLFVLVQPESFNWQGTQGVSLKDVIDKLMSIRIDDAVLADSGSSSMLLVDRVVEADTNDVQRDYSVPTGLAFRLQSLDLDSPATLTNTADTTDPTLLVQLVATGATGMISLESPGARIVIDTLGTTPAYPTPGALAAALGITLPYTLTTPNSNLAVATDFAGPPPALTTGPPQMTARLSLASTVTSDGRMTGTLTINNSRGRVVLAVDWAVRSP